MWFQLEDMFQLIVTPQGIKKVTIQLIDTHTKVYPIGARLFFSKVPLEVLQNWVLIQLIVTPHFLEKAQGQIKEVCRLIEPCLLIGTREQAWPWPPLSDPLPDQNVTDNTIMEKNNI